MFRLVPVPENRTRALSLSGALVMLITAELWDPLMTCKAASFCLVHLTTRRYFLSLLTTFVEILRPWTINLWFALATLLLAVFQTRSIFLMFDIKGLEIPLLSVLMDPEE